MLADRPLLADLSSSPRDGRQLSVAPLPENTFLRRWVDACSLKKSLTPWSTQSSSYFSPPPFLLRYWYTGFWDLVGEVGWGGFSVAVTDSWCRLVDFLFFSCCNWSQPFPQTLTHAQIISILPSCLSPSADWLLSSQNLMGVLKARAIHTRLTQGWSNTFSSLLRNLL